MCIDFIFAGTGEGINVIPISGPKITSAIWGPYEEYLITGHEDGRICHYDVKVNDFKLYMIHNHIFLPFLQRRTNFHDFLFASLENKARS